MPHPSLIEFVIDDTPIYLIFQAKASPLLALEIRDQDVHPNKCVDDGTLFPEGQPEDYVGKNIWFDEGLTWMLVPETVEGMAAAETCAFGDVEAGESGGSGPGFTYAGGDVFYHDESLGVSTDAGISQDALGVSSGLVVLIHRPKEYKVWKYYDENDPPQSKEPREDDADGEGDGADVDMDDEGAEQDQANGPADDLTGQMKTLRLKGD